MADSVPASSPPNRLSGAEALVAAREYLEQITGHSCETIIGLIRLEEGWAVTAVIVEVNRVPATTDILGRYEVKVDHEGGLLSCRRLSRYCRNQTLSDGS